jgi:hypothetical protein
MRRPMSGVAVAGRRRVEGEAVGSGPMMYPAMDDMRSRRRWLPLAVVVAAVGTAGTLFALKTAESAHDRVHTADRANGPTVFGLAPGEKRRFVYVARQEEMKCHGETYSLWQGGYTMEISTGVRVVAHKDGSVTAHCPRVLSPL